MCKSKYDSIVDDLNCNLKWLNAKYRIKFESLKVAFNIVNLNCPDLFEDYLTLETSSDPTTRTSLIV